MTKKPTINPKDKVQYVASTGTNPRKDAVEVHSVHPTDPDKVLVLHSDNTLAYVDVSQLQVK